MATYNPLNHHFIISLTLIISTLIPTTLSLTCTTQKLPTNKLYQNCNDLPTLNSYLHWTYSASNKTLSIAFIATPPSSSGWVSWAPNPTGTGMAGSSALLAYKTEKGVTVKTYKISSYSSIVEGKLDFEVYEKSAEFSGGVITIYAKLGVPESVVSGNGKLNHIWQVGNSVSGGFPDKHDFGQQNLAAKGSLDLNSGDSIDGGGGGGGVDSRMKKKNIHGILNAISWGLLFPLGAVIARYLRTFESADPAWFYLHIFCQISAYTIGVAGWATGLQLGNQSQGIIYTTHRNIGIALFCMATIQLFALLLRPKKDHKYRLFWNIYHHSVGYAIIILGIINVFKGLDILQPVHKWKALYVIIIIVLGGVSLFLEVVTWIVVYRKKSSKAKPYA